ncbi:hypothetical protein EMEDMD4_510037 [Sinorhizobium medicae]|uniref:Uncharacterized protein n=1 Tax=Sinorhizobium medicae TaxID=110321 RepID=A0A508X6H3_9HYPH|nr:hypothetical protein EMEDMD4_510037 [Sinorhizobium medicae]
MRSNETVVINRLRCTRRGLCAGLLVFFLRRFAHLLGTLAFDFLQRWLRVGLSFETDHRSSSWLTDWERSTKRLVLSPPSFDQYPLPPIAPFPAF